MNIQWWLVELDRYGNVSRMIDGAHSEAQGAHRAFYLIQRLGLIKSDTRYAVVRCELFLPVPSTEAVNEDALNALNAIGLSPNGN
jgi:predicted GNAT superfamily acetyltransferase